MPQYYPIRMIRLMTGETLIAGIADAGKNNYVLEKPMSITVMPMKQSVVEGADVKEDVGLYMKDWIDFSLDNCFIVPKTAVLCITIPNKMLVSDYSQAKIGNDVMREWSGAGFPETMSVADTDEGVVDEGEEDEGDQEPPTEFPGWGGDPRL